MRDRLKPLRPRSAPDSAELAVCPHCWHVNRHASRLCGRCGADMATTLQESGGARRAAAVQSPVPTPGARLSFPQRLLLLGFLALLALGQIVLALGPRHRAPPTARATPAAR